MSAYLCGPKTIATIVEWEQNSDRPGFLAKPAYYGGTNEDKPGIFFRELLLRQNLRSLHARYPRKVEELTPDEWEVYRNTPAVNGLGIVDMLKCVQCWQYQSCETEDYQDTQAWKYSHYVLSALISRLPGYEKAVWGLD